MTIRVDHTTAAAALADKTPGARTLQCTHAEASKLAGQPAVYWHPGDHVYSTPISPLPNTSRDDPMGIWHIGVWS